MRRRKNTTQIGEALREHWQKIFAEEGPLGPAKPPKYLYHYTGMRGLRGILSTGALWLTDVDALNDPSEIRFGFDRCLSALAASLPSPHQNTTLGAAVAGLFSDRHRKKVDHYVCSLSRTRNDIGQWRAYAQDGSVFALEFDAQQLVSNYRSTPPSGAERAMLPIRYGTKKLDFLINQIMSAVPNGTNSDEALIDVMVELVESFMNLALHFKHQAYRGECEYRLLELAPKGLLGREYHAGRTGSVAHRSFDWRSSVPTALRRIFVGPAADGKAEQKVARLLTAHRYGKNIEIIRSDIPYRRMR